MIRPPQYPEVVEPSAPQWLRWWLALPLLWGAQSAVLLTLWPEERPRLELWLWSAVLPLCWVLALLLRVLVWRLEVLKSVVYRRTRDAALLRWWQQRGLGLPVQQVLVLGPAGDAQLHYHDLMASAPLPRPTSASATQQPLLRYPFLLCTPDERPQALARQLARLTLALPDLDQRWKHLRGIAWVGDEGPRAAFAQVLANTAVLPKVEVALNDLQDLDRLIDAFHHECRDARDWLLCAGVVSGHSAPEGELPGEAGFVWLVSWQGKQLLHRGEYWRAETDESPGQLCAQLQRYAGLEAAPETCLALDQTSQQAFIDGGWSAAEHQLGGHWGALAHLAPFIAMSLALLQAGEARQPCGWLSQDAENRLAIGMAVAHGNSE